MVMLDEAFKPEDNKEKVLPVGTYTAKIVSSELKESKKGGGREYMNLGWEIIDGEYTGTRLFQMCTWKNPSLKAVEIGKAQFSQICEACGIELITCTEELHGKPCLIKTVIENNGDFGDQAKIKKVLKYSEKSTEEVETPFG